ncbi:tyrosine--tRNA ligase, partial [Patescibacteria group bacterium]|nr:tyrosine--tRNA ligase [Patescibacteria group bacterium]MBU1563656.1 tyrosine--tRNA ligase [Patescibacteria group bacterium]
MIQENKIEEVLTRGVENIYPNKEALEEVLKSGKKIKLYCGYDATAPTLHIGHAITLKKLKQFQNLGHEIIFLLGDFTTMIGDPTDKTATRKKLTREEVSENMKSYKEQAGKIISFEGENPAKVLYNSEWNDKLTFIELIELASNFTVQQMIQRDMFQQRIKDDKPIYLHEFLYPLTQAYDSVAMEVDLEVGGNDQTFNMLAGRDLMKAVKNKEKFVLTTKLLVDSSGVKMGKTEGNIVNLDEKPNQMFGQIMAWSDELIIPGFELLTDLDVKKIDNPRDDKAKLAKAIIEIFYSKKEAEEAEKEFEKIFKKKDKPTKIPIAKVSRGDYKIADLLFQIGLSI